MNFLRRRIFYQNPNPGIAGKFRRVFYTILGDLFNSSSPKIAKT